MDATPSAHLALLQKGNLLEIAPGIFRPANPAAVPEIVLARLRALGDGTYRLIPAGEAWARLDSATVAALGFAGAWNTILRLAAANFIEVVRVAPNTSLLNLASWWGHLKRCSEDPWYWQQPARLRAYRQAMREIGQRSHKRLRRRERPAGILAGGAA